MNVTILSYIYVTNYNYPNWANLDFLKITNISLYQSSPFCFVYWWGLCSSVSEEPCTTPCNQPFPRGLNLSIRGCLIFSNYQCCSGAMFPRYCLSIVRVLCCIIAPCPTLLTCVTHISTQLVYPLNPTYNSPCIKLPSISSIIVTPCYLYHCYAVVTYNLILEMHGG